MRIAIPVVDGRLAMHFGHCDHFSLVDVDSATKRIINQEVIAAPPHEPGLLPNWLKERGASAIIAGGMGSRARSLFTNLGIQVVTGAQSETPERLVNDFLAGTLRTGENVCDH